MKKLVSLLGVLALAAALHLTYLPVAEAFLFGDFGVKDEQELGEKFKQIVMTQMPLIRDPVIEGYVAGLVERLKAVAPSQPFNIQAYVLRSSTLNAFAAPGGYLFIHTGLLLNLNHESEVAGVMAHELAHITSRHIAGRINQMQKISLLSLAGALAGVFLAQGKNTGDAGAALLSGTMAASQSAMLKYSRDDETEADHTGMKYLTAAGFPPQGMAGAFEIMKAKQFLTGSGAPEYLSTHPGVDARVVEIKDQVKRLPADSRSRPENDTEFRRAQTLVRSWYTPADSALDYYDRLASPECIDTLGRAIALSRLQRVNEAQEAFDRAEACMPGDSLVAREAGRFQYQTGNFKAAAMNLQKAVFMSPKDDMALYFYARLLGDTGQADQAAEYYERILKRLPEDSEIHFHYGRLLGKQQKLFDAHLHLAYASLYENNMKQTNFHKDKIKSLATTEEQKARLDEFNKLVEKRTEALSPGL